MTAPCGLPRAPTSAARDVTRRVLSSHGASKFFLGSKCFLKPRTHFGSCVAVAASGRAAGVASVPEQKAYAFLWSFSF